LLVEKEQKYKKKKEHTSKEYTFIALQSITQISFQNSYYKISIIQNIKIYFLKDFVF